jgi:hypothetical protein
MHKVEPIKWMILVFDTTIHVHSAPVARMPLDCCLRIDNHEVVTVSRNYNFIAWNNRHKREQCAFGLPALRAATRMTIGSIRGKRDLHWIARAVTQQASAGKVLGCRSYPIVDCWVD